MGLIEVARIRQALLHRVHRVHRDGPEFLSRHVVPVGYGPQDRLYLVDHHHIVRAIHEKGARHVLASPLRSIQAPLRCLLDIHGQSQSDPPIRCRRQRHSHRRLLQSVESLEDDPYPTLAGMVLRTGGSAKENIPYAEFLWADFFRRLIKRNALEAAFDRWVTHALDIARSHGAHCLLGWAGAKK